MSKSYLLKASEGEFGRWRAAAGELSLAVWIRESLNAACGAGAPVAPSSGAWWDGERLVSFKGPDPRPGKRS
jgi:hypothetical protein